MANRPPTYDELAYMVQVMVERVKELEAEVHRLKNQKNSGNSSIPPSKDENRPRKNQSLRTKSGKPSGGQKGHKGKTLEMVAHADEVIRHVPCACSQCGSDLAGIKEFYKGRRQVLDIPPIQPQYTEHQVYSKQCKCGHINSGSFPSALYQSFNQRP